MSVVIPVPVIVAEIVMALGGALLGANLWALVRPRFDPSAPPPPARGRILVNCLIGAVVLTWGFASLMARR